MSGIEAISELQTNLGLAAGNMGIKPGEINDPEKSFSRLLDENLRQKKEEDTSSPGIVPRQTHIDKTDKLYEQCQALETFLVKNIRSSMRKNVMKASLIDTGFAGEVYEDMLWDEYAKEYTKNAGFGLADLAYLELTGQRGRKI
jgi:flagellar protein FlgJ